MAKSRVSGEIADLKTERVIGWYAFEALKVFVPRESRTEVKRGEWVTLAEGLEGSCSIQGGRVVL